MIEFWPYVLAMLKDMYTWNIQFQVMSRRKDRQHYEEYIYIYRLFLQRQYVTADLQKYSTSKKPNGKINATISTFNSNRNSK